MVRSRSLSFSYLKAPFGTFSTDVGVVAALPVTAFELFALEVPLPTAIKSGGLTGPVGPLKGPSELSTFFVRDTLLGSAGCAAAARA